MMNLRDCWYTISRQFVYRHYQDSLSRESVHVLEDLVLFLADGSPFSVLDCGCATGKDYDVFKKYRFIDYRGIDWVDLFIETACRLSRESCFDVCSIDDMPFFSRQFDLVYTKHVLEFLSGPSEVRAALGEMARVTKSWLLLVLSTEVSIRTITRRQEFCGEVLPYNDYSLRFLTRVLAQCSFALEQNLHVGCDTLLLFYRVGP